MTPLILLCAAHAALCDAHHNRMAWPLPAVASPMQCISAAQMTAPTLAIRPRHDVRRGNDRMVVVCVGIGRN